MGCGKPHKGKSMDYKKAMPKKKKAKKKAAKKPKKMSY